jgi:hypothetical protein
MKLCFIILSFGDGRPEHGKSNQMLAIEAMDYSKRWEAPIIAQWEVACTIAKHHSDNIILDSIHMKKDEKYLKTRQVLKRAKEIMEERGYDAAIFFAHPAHLPRVRFTARQEHIKEARQIVLDIPWDRSSTQVWTRNPCIWWSREIFSFVLTLLRLI